MRENVLSLKFSTIFIHKRENPREHSSFDNRKKFGTDSNSSAQDGANVTFCVTQTLDLSLHDVPK